MTREQEFFFQVLRDYLNGRATDPAEGLDLSQICDWAEMHKLGGIFHVQCGPLFRKQPALAERLSVSFGGAICHMMTLRADMELLREAFDENGIPYTPVKGALVADFYPDPELRTMGDIDLLVRAEDSDRIRACLTPLGFQNTKSGEIEWNYEKQNSIFELHSYLVRVRDREETAYDRFFNGYERHTTPGKGACRDLDWDFHFLYLISHIAGHIRLSGIGFRQFYDLAVLMRRCPERFHWDRIRSQAEEIGFFPFVRSALALSERWFGVPSPFGGDAVSDALFAEMTDTIFRNGVFGYQNEDSSVHLVAKEISRASLPLPLARLNAARKLVFPPYRDLVKSSKYSYLRGKPWLLPVAWGRRMFQAKGKKSRLHTVSTVIGADADVLDRRARQLRELGL